ncbi:MAG: SRPBCC family protein, partial [bacterium]
MIVSSSLRNILLLSVLAVTALPRGGGTGAVESSRAQEPEVVVKDTLDGGFYAAGRIHIPAVDAQVWDVISDFDNLTSFIPNMPESEIVAERDSVMIVRQKINSRYFLFSKSIELTLQIVEHPPNALHFELVEGPFWYYRGGWHIDSASSTSGVWLSYRLLMKPDFFSTASAIKTIMRKQLKETLLGVGEEVKRRYSGENP